MKSIAKGIGRDPRKIEKFIDDPMRKVTRKDEGKSRTVTRQNLSMITRELKRNPSLTSGEIFKGAGLENVPNTTRCRILRTVATHVSPIVRPLLKESHRKTRVSWAENFFKIDFQTVLFTEDQFGSVAEEATGSTQEKHFAGFESHCEPMVDL